MSNFKPFSVKKILITLSLVLVFCLAKSEPITITIYGTLECEQVGNFVFVSCAPPLDVICFKLIIDDANAVVNAGEQTFNVESTYSETVDENGNPVYTFSIKE